MAMSIPLSVGNLPTQMTTLIKPALWLVPLALASVLVIDIIEDLEVFSSANTVKPAQHSKNTHKVTMNAGQIANLHIFGKFGDSAPERQESQNLPQTRLQLDLKGAFTNTQADLASALIATKGKPSKRYFINDTLPGGAKLHAVNTDSVTLDRGGNLEILRFPKAKSGPVRVSARRRGAPIRTKINGPVHGNHSPASRNTPGARHNNRVR